MALVSRCCCFDLRTGAMILGWLGLVGGIGGLIGGISMVSIDFSSHISTSMRVRSGYGEQEIYEPQVNEAFKIISSVVKVSAYGFIAGSVVSILMDIGLIYGTVNNKRLLLLPWLITRGITLSLVGLGVLIGGIILFVINQIGAGIVFWIISLPITALHIYCWICVQSLFKKFDEEESFNMRMINDQNGFQRLIAYNNTV